MRGDLYMPFVLSGIDVANLLSLVVFLVLWIVLFECAHVLVTMLRHGPLIGWAVGPLGVTVMLVQEPSTLFLWLNVLFPALVSPFVLYFGLSPSLSPISIPNR